MVFEKRLYNERVLVVGLLLWLILHHSVLSFRANHGNWKSEPQAEHGKVSDRSISCLHYIVEKGLMSFTQRHARVNISSMVRFLSLSFKLYGPVYSYRNIFLQGSNGTQTCPEDSGDRKGKRPLGRRQDVCTRGKYCVIKRDQRVEEKCLY